MSKKKATREYEAMYEAELSAYGCTFRFDRLAKHPAVVFTTPTGLTRTFTFSGNDADRMRILNHRRDVRRFMAENGVKRVA